jgi:signal peptidase
MDKRKLKKNLIDIGKDVLIAFVVVALVMLAIYAYSGIWPPMVVVESGSMQRYDDKSVIGVIDTGDMVFVKKVNGVNDVVTYVDGEATDYSKYGAYGDVIIYRPNGLSVRNDGSTVVPIIHRLVVWLEVNDTRVSTSFDGIDYANYSFDVPSLGLYNTTKNIILSNYGFWNEEINITLGRDNGLLEYYEYFNKVPHGGYITMGDHNVPAYDQPMSGQYEPILPEWIVGKAIGELPWFGLIKLKVTGTNLEGVPGNSWTNLMITLFVLLFLPFAFDYIYPKIKKKMKAKKEVKDTITEPGKDEISCPPEGATPPEKPDDTAKPGGGDIQTPAPEESAKIEK